MKTGNEAWDRDDRSKEFNRQQIDQLLHIPGQQAEYMGWDVRFMGWRVPVDQFVEFGVWVATHGDNAPGFWYSTTTGTVRFQGNLAAPIDFTYGDEKPRMVGSFGQRDAAVRALDRLLKQLKTLA